MPRTSAPPGLDLALYGGTDPRELPRYSYAAAARATGVPASTIAAWVRGMPYTVKGEKRQFISVIERPERGDTKLSFHNLIEANALRALREVHEVNLKAIRHAIKQAKEEHGIDRLLIHPQLRTTGGELFLDYYFQLVTLSPSRQLAMREMLKGFLQRVEIDDKLQHAAFFPIPKTPGYRDRRVVMVSPFVAFGNPVVGSIGVSTSAIAERVNAGEGAEIVRKDYGLSEDEFREAILYEEAA